MVNIQIIQIIHTVPTMPNTFSNQALTLKKYTTLTTNYTADNGKYINYTNYTQCNYIYTK